jgi:hypothetical protein
MRTAMLSLLVVLLSVGAATAQSQNTSSLKKDPAAGALFGALIPGGGHYYAGETGKGIVLSSIGVATGIAETTAAIDCGFLQDGTPRRGICDAQAIFVVVGLFNLAYSIGDGRQAAIRHNQALGLTSGPAQLRPIATTQGGRSAYGVRLKVAL